LGQTDFLRRKISEDKSPPVTGNNSAVETGREIRKKASSDWKPEKKQRTTGMGRRPQKSYGITVNTVIFSWKLMKKKRGKTRGGEEGKTGGLT